MAKTLKQRRVAVSQAFELFDGDKDGELSRGEFIDALAHLGLRDLPGSDVSLLMNAIDADGDGNIQYAEFTRKLERCGLRNLSKPEVLVYGIITARKRLNMSREELFRFINKDGAGLLTRKDFRDVLSSLNMKEVRDADITHFINYFYKDSEGGMDQQSFKRIFDKYERQADIDEQKELEEKKRQFDDDSMQVTGFDTGARGDAAGLTSLKELEYQRKLDSLAEQLKQA